MPPRLRPQLIALDLDGTVVDNRNEIPPATAAALRACHAAGIALAFLTGRRPYTTAPHLDALGLPCQVATNSGCLRWRYPGWQQTGARLFEPALVGPVTDMLAPHSANLYVNSLEADVDFYLLDREPQAELELYIKHYSSRIQRIRDVSGLNGTRVTQIAMPGPAEVVLALRDRINAAYPGRVNALAVRWPLLGILALELFHPEANKGDALAQFAGELGLAQAWTLAVGDDVNDLAMLAWAGHGVAMPEASPELARAADEVLPGTGAAALAPYLNALLELPAE